jgi:hypothetical protein
MVEEFLLYWFPLVGVVTSIVYFMAAPKGDPFRRRFATSLHGASTTIVYLATMSFVWSKMATAESGVKMPFNPVLVTFSDVILFLTVAQIIGSLVLFRGPKAFHLLQIVNIACLAYTWFWMSAVGQMAATGNWI